MSKPLSVSVTFEALESRVDALEARTTAPTVQFAGDVLSHDANFGLILSGGSSILSFDATDGLIYSRGSNVLNVTIGAVTQMSVTSAAVTVFNTLSVGDASFAFGITSGNPVALFDAGDYIQYNRSTNIYAFNIGNSTMAQVDSAGNVLATGGIYANGDAQFFLLKASGNPIINLDSGDFIKYDRTANKFYFIVNNVSVASIDASGNMKLAGTLTQSTTP